MLVLTRHHNETIVIGKDIEVTIVAIRGDKVKLGITAPPEVPVHRKEVAEEIARERGESALEDALDDNRPKIRSS